MIVVNDVMHPAPFLGLECIIFDCDGVLIDSWDANVRYYSQIKEHLGLSELTGAEMEYCHSHTHLDAVRFMVPADRLEEVWAYQETFEYRILLPYLRRYPGLRGFLWWLRDAGFHMAVNTSRMDTMDMVIQTMDLEGFFHPVITASKVSRPKPSPEGVFEILNALDLRPDQVAYIGDSTVDERTARAAGVRFWRFGNTPMEADLHIPDYPALKRAMQRAYPLAGRRI